VLVKKHAPTAQRAVVASTSAVRFVGITSLPSGTLASYDTKAPTAAAAEVLHTNVRNAGNAAYGASSRPSERYVIGRLDRGDRTLTLTDVGDVYEMRPCKVVDGVEPVNEDDDGVTRTRAEQTREVVDQFGSRKRQRKMHAMVEARVTAETTVVGGEQAALELAERVIANPAVGASTEAAAERTDLPPFDSETDDVSKVYHSGKLVPKTFRVRLREQLPEARLRAKRLAVARAHATPDWQRAVDEDGEFVCRMFADVDAKLASATPEAATKLEQRLMLLDFLCNLRRLYFAQHELQASARVTERCKLAPMFFDAVSTLFCEARPLERGEQADAPGVVHYLRPKYLRDRLTNYICIVMLLVNDYTIALTDVQNSLGLETRL
jgi:hypothetical protein